MSVSPAEVVDELAQLSADQIAERFETLGIKGRTHQACHCPVSRYLDMIFEDTAVAAQFIEFWNSEDHQTVNITGTSIEQFVIRFDNRHYEGLIDGRSPVRAP